LEAVEKSLSDHNIAYTIFDETEPNPSAESIMKGLEQLKLQSYDYVLAFGGGSSIDTAKGIGIMAGNPGHILDYEGVGKIMNPGIPLVVIPTTAGTGSEVTAATIVTNSQTHFKAAVISPHLYPKLALLDPLLTEKLPPDITAATGMDALTHAIESYTSKTANPASRALAIEAIRMIGKNLTKAFFVGSDMASREHMLMASMMAGAAFAQSRLGNVHAISHTLGGVFNIAHGIANAVLLPFVMRFNLPACPEQMRDIAEALGEDTYQIPVTEAAEKAIAAVIKLNKSLNIPLNIKDLGVSLDQLSKLVEDSMKSGNVLINPRLTKPADIKLIIENAYNGVL
jgi:alcohol dehydrogenase class IV